MPQNWEDTVLKVDTPISQRKATQLLNICHESWKRYELIAKKIPDYTKEIEWAAQRAANYGVTRVPVTPYRLWVIAAISKLFQSQPQGTAKVWIVEESVTTNLDRLSKISFLRAKLAYKNRRQADANVHTAGSRSNNGDGSSSFAIMHFRSQTA